MIISYLHGGMGNQLFQFSMAYSQSRRLSTGLLLDVTSFVKDPMREYSLDLWSGIGGRYTKVVRSIIDIHEDGMPHNPALIEKVTSDSCLKGYWQTDKYFDKYGSELYKIFQPGKFISPESRDTLRLIQQAGQRSVFLTIRRTDYVGNEFHGELSMDYYSAALETVNNGVKDPHVFVFSDDPAWVAANFDIPYTHTIAGNFDRTVKGHLGREDAELFLMSQCRHAVMANSSYSWWGAYLGDLNPEFQAYKRVVICPKQWFGPMSTENPIDIPRKNWTQL